MNNNAITYKFVTRFVGGCALLASAIAQATPADIFNDTWFAVELSASLAKASVPDWNHEGPWALNTSVIKAASLKNQCYLHILSSETEPYTFETKTFCSINGTWEKVGQGLLYDLSASSAANVGSDFFTLYVAPNGISTKTETSPWLGYLGSFYLSAKIDKGILKSVKASSSTLGTFDLSNADTSIYGTGKGSFKITFIPSATMQQLNPGAIECQQKSDRLNNQIPTELCDETTAN